MNILMYIYIKFEDLITHFIVTDHLKSTHHPEHDCLHLG